MRLLTVFIKREKRHKELTQTSHLPDRISDGRHDSTGNLAVLYVMLEKMHNRLVLLPKRQQRLLAYHYGLGLLDCNTISENAAYFHLTEKYVEEIEQGR